MDAPMGVPLIRELYAIKADIRGRCPMAPLLLARNGQHQPWCG